MHSGVTAQGSVCSMPLRASPQFLQCPDDWKTHLCVAAAVACCPFVSPTGVQVTEDLNFPWQRSLELLALLAEPARDLSDFDILFCSYCPRRHAGRNLQPGETDHRRAVRSLHLGPSKGKIMKIERFFYFHFLTKDVIYCI